jgi:AGCS family alanine or glycine:cation symporter
MPPIRRILPLVLLLALLTPLAAAGAEAAPAAVPVALEESGGLMERLDAFWGSKVNGPIAKAFFAPVPIGFGETVPLTVLVLIVGAVFFTLRMGFVNFRAFGHAIAVTRGKYDNPDDEGEVSHFQALTAALSATVGLGNIASVTIAVGVGGPGAIFWMMVAGVLGMSSKFVECSLGQMYREVRPNGQVMGGAMYYLSNGLKEKGLGGLGKFLAVFFAILCVGGSLAGGNAFQVNQSLNAVQQSVTFLADHRWIYGLAMTVAVGFVIIGGIKRIAATAEKVVPAMCATYVIACIAILIMMRDLVPGAVSLIFSEAFALESMYGGLIGVLVLGFKRAAFSNEAGIGSAAIAHSAARTEYPVREGIVALLEPFIDTVVVCSMTGLVIVVTGAYTGVSDAYSAEILSRTGHDVARYAPLIAADQGASVTSMAFGSVISWFPWVLSVAVMLFAFSTMISWSYYGERCWCWMFGDRSSLIFKLLFLTFTFLGSILSATNVLGFGDLMILGMAFPNIIGLVLLSGKVRGQLDAYWTKLKAGELETY